MSDIQNLGFLISDVEEVTPVEAIENMVKMLGKSSALYTEQFKILEKSLNDGKQRRILGGYAAGTTRDFQDEKFILPYIDFSYLNTPNGRLNHDHNRSLIVGRPMYAGMIPDQGVYVKGILREKGDCPNPTHPNTIESLDKADELWDLAKSHQQNPSANAPLGYSVEGLKAVNKSGMIKKAIVTDVAITERAVNPNDCTVSILAKSILANQQQEAIKIIEKTGFPVDEINNCKDYLAHMSKEGFPLNFSKNLFNKIRSL